MLVSISAGQCNFCFHLVRPIQDMGLGLQTWQRQTLVLPGLQGPLCPQEGWRHRSWCPSRFEVQKEALQSKEAEELQRPAGCKPSGQPHGPCKPNTAPVSQTSVKTLKEGYVQPPSVRLNLILSEDPLKTVLKFSVLQNFGIEQNLQNQKESSIIRQVKFEQIQEDLACSSEMGPSPLQPQLNQAHP